MATRMELYRMQDGNTPLSEIYFNPIWQDIDFRFAQLENLAVSWDAAVRRISDLGLTRINEVLRPALDAVDQSVSNAAQMIDDVEQSRLAALAQVSELEHQVAMMTTELSQALAAVTTQVEHYEAAANTDIASWKVARLADLESWKAARLTELDAWRAELSAALPEINRRLATMEDRQSGQHMDAQAITARVSTLEALVYAAL